MPLPPPEALPVLRSGLWRLSTPPVWLAPCSTGLVKSNALSTGGLLLTGKRDMRQSSDWTFAASHGVVAA